MGKSKFRCSVAQLTSQVFPFPSRTCALIIEWFAAPRANKWVDWVVAVGLGAPKHAASMLSATFPRPLTSLGDELENCAEAYRGMSERMAKIRGASDILPRQ